MDWGPAVRAGLDGDVVGATKSWPVGHFTTLRSEPGEIAGGPHLAVYLRTRSVDSRTHEVPEGRGTWVGHAKMEHDIRNVAFRTAYGGQYEWNSWFHGPGNCGAAGD